MSTPFYRKPASEQREIVDSIMGLSHGRVREILTSALSANSNLVDAINVTGGLVRDAKGSQVPAADTAWVDLADSSIEAAKALKRAGIEEPVKLTN